MSDESGRLKRKIERLKKSQAEAEHLLEQKSREIYTLNQSLETQVLKRTQELEVAMNEAIEATKAKDRFLARMSHEIRTPLNGIIGILGLLDKTELTEEQRDYVNISNESGEILLSIINDILEYSRIAAGKVQIELKPFDFEKCIEAVADIMYFKAQEKNISLNVFVDENIPAQFISDERKIRQILINLIGNSIKFTPSGHIGVRLEKSQEGVRLSVSDTGIGIPDDKLETVFQSFSQADAADTRKYGGSGLGLSICKSFVDVLGGEIEVKSQAGVGTTFSFTLKNHGENEAKSSKVNLAEHSLIVCLGDKALEDGVKEKMKDWFVEAETVYSFEELNKVLLASQSKSQHLLVDQSMLPDQWSGPTDLDINILAELANGDELKKNFPGAHVIKPPLHRSKLLSIFQRHSDNVKSIKSVGSELQETHKDVPVLLVEDNLINQKVAIHILNSAGLSCDVASNGEEAVEQACRNFYPIILMDYNMPIMDGVRATELIRENQEGMGQRSFIVAMTASAMKETREMCVEAGMDDFVTKPIHADDLIDRIKRLLEKARKAS